MAKLLDCFTLFLVVSLTFSITIRPTIANLDCSNDIAGLTKNCINYIKFPSNPKKNPSKECCEVVNKCKVKCVCDHVTKELEKTISMEKVVYVAKKCGRPLPKGSKCGSYKVPPSEMLR